MPEIKSILFINLDKDSERRQLLEQRIGDFFPGIPVKRVRGIPMESISEFEGFFSHRLVNKLSPLGEEYPSGGTIGCFLAHYFALQDIQKTVGGHQTESDRGESAYLVLEDDCVFDQSVLPAIRNAMQSHLPEDWKIAKHSLGNSNKSDRINRFFFKISRARKRRWSYYYGTHFLIYRASAIADIIGQMETQPIFDFDEWMRDHIDGVYSFARRIHIKQSNLGGSNINPQVTAYEYEDRTTQFGLADFFPYIMRGIRRRIRSMRLKRRLERK